ncbi:MAG: alpha/beta hydrolase [Cytophagales bacterium]|nr:alpha/beta hydrolase [Cytophagales bacterium]
MVYYQKQGSGTCILLIHGFNETHEIWNEFTSALSDKYCVITIDLPGFGQSTELPQVTIDILAHEIYQLLTSLKIAKAVVAGHSLGGYVALSLAEQYPHLLQGLVLFHSTAYADTDEKKANRNKANEFISKHGAEPFLKNFYPLLFADAHKDMYVNDMEKLYNIGIKTSANVIINTNSAMRDRADKTHVLKNATFPILFIAGKNDNAVLYTHTVAQSIMPKISCLFLIDNCGHMGMIEQKDMTLKMLRCFADICFF